MGYIYKGEQARNMERDYGLLKEITYFEQERVDKDIKNTYKNKELYRLFWILQEQLYREGMI